ncbi:MAG TPA: FkbM family methyltransferase [Acidimicrobiia bacterium]|jgi:FkbM family methyltransferase
MDARRHPVVDGHAITVAGDPADQYFTSLVDGRDATDNVLHAVRPLVRNGDVVVDVGANLGIHAIALSRLTPDGHVYAIEAAERTVGLLRANVDANDTGNVTVVHAAMSAEPGTLRLYVNREYAAGSMVVEHASALFQSHLAIAQTGDGAQPADPTRTPWGDVQEVTTMTLDQLTADLERVDVIKIDTEGHDMQVLAGARDTLRRFRPAVAMEFSSFALTLHESTLPADALTTIRDTFDRVFVIEPDGRLAPVVTDTDAWRLLQDNATSRPVHDLLGVFDGTPALERVLAEVEARGRTPEPVPQPDLSLEIERLVLELDATRARLDATDADRQRVQTELDAVHRTVSWRVTKPLRDVARRFRPR